MTYIETAPRTLSKNEARIILDLEWRGQKNLTLEEVRSRLACSDNYARFLAHQLVRKRWLERLRSGMYQLIPAERGPEGVADTNPLAAGALLIKPYFYSFGTACNHHGLTEQVFSEIYLACRKNRKPEEVRGIRYLFAYMSEKRFFGFKETTVFGAAVQMATPERAMLDALDRPRYAGGIGEVSRMIARSKTKLSWETLFDLLKGWNNSALTQRLGYLLELHNIDLPSRFVPRLKKLVLPDSKILLASRRKWGTSGRLVAAWNIIVNVPDTVLMEGGGRPGRRVTLKRSAQHK